MAFKKLTWNFSRSHTTTTTTTTKHTHYLSCVMRKPAFYICENKDADQLRGKREADQRLCFRYKDSTIPQLHISENSSLCSQLLWLCSLVCVRPGRKPRRPVFSQRGSYVLVILRHSALERITCLVVTPSHSDMCIIQDCGTRHGHWL